MRVSRPSTSWSSLVLVSLLAACGDPAGSNNGISQTDSAPVTDATSPTDGTTRPDGARPDAHLPPADGAVLPADARMPTPDVAPPPGDGAVPPDGPQVIRDGAQIPLDATPTPDVAVLPPDATVVPHDAGPPPLDAAPPPADMAVVPVDAAIPTFDLFMPGPDAFVPPPDAFVPVVDAFVPVVDAFVPVVDAFVPVVDAFVPVEDAFVPVVDAFVPLDAAIPQDPCTQCHGGVDGPAPPRALNNSVQTTYVGVGAHQRHLTAGFLRGPVACSECHVVPNDLWDPGHLGAAPADLTFGPLAAANGANPSWNHAQARCSGTYCHGGTLHGGAVAAPLWTQVDGSQITCDSCHGAPPPAPHPQNPDCRHCHPGTIGPNGLINVAGGLHMDGQVEFDANAVQCDTCHGSNGAPAPPRALNGSFDTATPGVGAHQTHLQAGHIRGTPIACNECHVVPAAVGDATHMDASPGAELTFGALASNAGTHPVYDRVANVCSNVYCHGATLPGGTLTTPRWTLVDGSQRACGTCHGAPPPAPHPQDQRCQYCHPQTVLGNGSINLAGGTHINGRIDVQPAGCDTCHGSNGNPAPPRALDGSVDTTAPGVGAHRAHLDGGAIRGPIDCDQCHVVPAAVDSVGHIEGDPGAEVTFGALAENAGAAPSFDPVATTCANVYCHGATLAGGVVEAPQWTLVDGTQTTCDACHGAPPPAPHPQAANCNTCHPGTVRANGQIDVAGGLHINGQIEVQMAGCDACHGSNGVAAPPRDLAGNLGTASPGVGAHRAHLSGVHLRPPVACNECHPVPGAVGDESHLDAVPGVTIEFGVMATNAGANPQFNQAQHSCSNVYCHGATLSGGLRKSPVWNRVDGTQRTCDSCHGAPPPAPHPPRQDCTTCHPATVNPDGTIDVAGGHHMDGRVDVAQLECDACHGGGGDPAPPVAVNGATLPSDPGVGAHDAHLRGSSIRGPVECTECHTVPNNYLDVGHLDLTPGAELTFGPLATAEATDPVYDRPSATCDNVYCHGATLAGGVDVTPIWTAAPADPAAPPLSCDTCHGAPPPAPHPGYDNCNACHPGTVRSDGTIDLAGGQHIDGQVEAQIPGCDGCHGSAASAAPPRALDGSLLTTALGVGAHQTHLTGSALRGPIPCNSCHLVPGDVRAAGHLDGDGTAELSFGGLAVADNAAPVWDRATGTCSGVYCHGATRGGGTNKTPHWTQVDGSQMTCGSCHGLPPPAPHVNSQRCQLCHTRTVNPDGTINLASGTHINGQVDVEMPGCNGCHGSVANAAPPAALNGSVNTATAGVGAHQSHLLGGAFSAPIACTECHIVPGAVQAAGHLDNVAGAEVIFGALATTDGSAPSYNAANNRCSDVYCHGATLTGGTVVTPQWNRVDGTQAACGTCHGAPPPAPHVQSNACYRCHPGTMNANGTLNLAGGLHVNGTIDSVPGHAAGWEQGNRHGAAFNAGGPGACGACHGADLLGGDVGVSCEQCHPGWRTGCNFCHGGRDNQTGAPPDSVAGLSDRALPAVGVHTKHVAATALHTAFACSKCHINPADALSPGHIDGDNRAEVRMDSRNVAATYSLANATCTSMYCHGDAVIASPAVSWTAVGQLACSACHDDATIPSAQNTLRGQHRLHVLSQRYLCYECHNTVVNAANAIINPALHVNEVTNVAFLPAGFTYSAGRCTGTCHSKTHSGYRW